MHQWHLPCHCQTRPSDASGSVGVRRRQRSLQIGSQRWNESDDHDRFSFRIRFPFHVSPCLLSRKVFFFSSTLSFPFKIKRDFRIIMYPF